MASGGPAGRTGGWPYALPATAGRPAARAGGSHASDSSSGIGPIRTGKRELTHFPHCADVSKYERLCKVGQGTFGEVYKGRDRATRRLVALKKILMENEKEGFPLTALREIKILTSLSHDNIVKLYEICRGKPLTPHRATIYLVFEFCDHDLAGLISNINVNIQLAEAKNIAQQLLTALFFLHSNKVLHRDLKSANILLTKDGKLKLADFGLARAFSTSLRDKRRYTNRVVTLWYRPPELILGARDYGPAIDMWGAGCIIAELMTRTPIMQGRNEINQLKLITALCGQITEESMPGCTTLAYAEKMNLESLGGQKGTPLSVRLQRYSNDPLALDLIDKLLQLDPKKRLSADPALNHDFFWSDPLPCDLTKMLSTLTVSNFEYTANRRPTGPPAASAAGGAGASHAAASSAGLGGASGVDSQYVEPIY